MVKGIDISGYQGAADFSKVRESGVEFVLIKAGYSNSTVESWERNYAAVKAAGLHVGAYWFSYAKTIADGRNEASCFIEALKGKQLDYPVYLDMEYQLQFDKGKAFCSELTDTFCGALKRAGYYPGLYMSRISLQTYISPEIAGKYQLWIAEYAPKLNYSGDYGIWQYSDDGRVSGITGKVDLDYGYKDYPKIIRSGGYNGYSKPDPEKTVDEIAREVIRGDWGNGEERYERLTAAGYDYDEVQAKVNELLYGVPPKKTIDEIAREVIRGDWGNGEERYERLTAAGYDYVEVQAKVNELLYGVPPKKTIDEIAREVIRGDWGNGEERYERLTAAGYDYDAVQKRVEELL